jgi:hypothetical protein
MSTLSSSFAHPEGKGSMLGPIIGLIIFTALLSACAQPPESASPKTDSSESQTASAEETPTAPPSPVAATQTVTSPTDANANMGASDAKTAVQRNMTALNDILPGIQGNYVDDKDGVIVLDIYATGDAVKAAQAKQAEVERLLGHPVRMNFLDAPLTEQMDEEKK